MKLIGLISKLPNDLHDVMHILPFWYRYLYWTLWIGGTVLAIILLVTGLYRFFKYLDSRPAKEAPISLPKEKRKITKTEILRDLRILNQNTKNSQDWRFGLHRLSGLLKTYFEILLEIEIEEMTATEIRRVLKDKKPVGDFFVELAISQYGISDPDEPTFDEHYKIAMGLVNTNR